MRRPPLAAALYAPFLAGWGTWLATSLAGSRRLRRRRARPATAPGVRLDVLIPAHDEASSVGGLVRSVLDDGGRCVRRVLVVADHCTDDTAEVARRAGAYVLVRDRGPRGKPAALRDGLDLLGSSGDHADGVLFLDADVQLAPGFVGRMAHELASGTDAIQSANLATRHDGAAGTGVELGIYLRNLLRPAGLTALGCPTHLTGTGMLLSRRALAATAFGDHLAEDLALTQDLVQVGIYPRLVPEAVQHSALPDSAGLDAQRQRWEGGQLATLRRVPRLAWNLARAGRGRGLVGVADWSSPPMTLSVAALGVAAGGHLAGVASRRARPSGLVWPLAAATTLGAYLALGAVSYGGRGAAAELARRVPAYAVWKLRVYTRMARRPMIAWERTSRAATTESETPHPPAVEAAHQGT